MTVLTQVGTTGDGEPIVVAEQAHPTLTRKGWVGFAAIKGKLYKLPDGRWIRVRCYEDIDLWEKLNAEASGTKLDAEDHETRDGHREIDNSPEAVEARRIAKARKAEAIAYVASYTGTWGLPLDIRSDRRWGTAKMTLSEKQVEALLRGKARDQERSEANLELARINTELANDDEWLAALCRSCLDAKDRPHVHQPPHGPFQPAPYPEAPDDARPTTPEAPRLAAQPTPGTRPARAAAEGFYKRGDTVFKVQRAVHGSGNLYAKRLDIDADGKPHWEYAPGMIWQLTEADRLSLDEAEAFGKLYGVCAICGRTLTDESSIARGIGPVCASKIAGG